MVFYLPPLKWSPPRGMSLERIAQELQRVILAHPEHARKHQWPTDLKAIEDWVDLYNATVCARNGWTEYITADAEVTVPKPSAPHQQETLRSLRNAAVAAKRLVSGAKTLKEWLDSGEPAVPPDQALKRATVCSQCPHNAKGDLTAWFTTPASEYIRRQVEKAQARKLITPRDDDLNICDVCHCPLKLKVWTPSSWILKRLDPETLSLLRAVPKCWVGGESEPPSPGND